MTVATVATEDSLLRHRDIPGARSFCMNNATTRQDLLFEGLPGPVRLVLPAEEMEEAYGQYALWPHECVSPKGEPLLLLRPEGENEDFSANVEVDGDGPYILEKDPTLDFGVRREESLAAGLCSLNIAMVTHLCRSRGLLCLHGALLSPDSENSDEASSGLLILGNNRAGKSTLTVRLMAEGLVSHGDDMLGLEPEGTMIALGIAPRLRLPLPASARLADFVAKHRGTGDERATFLVPNAAIMSPFGTRCRAGHIVVLERRAEEMPARLVRLEPAEALDELVFRFYLQEGTALSALECATRLASTVPCHVLVYSDLDEACALLASLLAGEDIESATLSEGPCKRPAPSYSLSRLKEEDNEGAQPPELPQILPEQEYRQCEGAELVTCLGKSFLANREQNDLHALNETGRVLWLMLADPISVAEASLLVREAYPMISRAQIKEDVCNLFADLLDAGLIEPA